jgi:enediyne biosynthesis protein E4
VDPEPVPSKTAPKTQGNLTGDQGVPDVQIKFTIIFGLLALIPFLLFYFYGLENTDQRQSGSTLSTNLIPTAVFTEIAESAGITFQHVNGAAGEKLLPETMGGGCAFFDFDNDGDQDILLVNSSHWPWARAEENPTHALYANDGKGSYTDVTTGSGVDFTSYGMGAAVGDFDNDGWIDVYVTSLGSNKLLRNEGGGKFHDITGATGVGGKTNDWSTSAAFLDYDRDGDLDLFVCNYVQWSREIDLQVDYRLPGVGRAYGPPMSFGGSSPVLYRNDGAGKFMDVSRLAGVQVTNKATGLALAKSLGVSPIDLDRDGWLDLVVANDTVQNFVFHNNGNGTFTEMGGRSGLAYDKFGSTRGAMGIDTGPFQDNNTLAISIGNFANEMTAFYVAQRDPLLFSDEALEVGIGAPTRTLLTFGVFFFDFDLDGHLDLLTANGHIEPEIGKVHPNQNYLQPAQLFWNSSQAGPPGGLRLVPPAKCGPDLYRPMAGRGSAYADIDNDGDLDFLITELNGKPRLFRNDQQLNHNWVRVKLIGKKSNRDAVGAWLQLRIGSKVFAQQVMPTRGYLSQSELPITIGLGAASAIDEVQIQWPDGSRDTGVQLKINNLNTVSQR